MNDKPLPSVADTYRRITGIDPRSSTYHPAAHTVAVKCVSTANHRHGDASPSLHIHLDKDVWVCRVCTDAGKQMGGKSLDLVVHAGLATDRSAAVKWLVPTEPKRARRPPPPVNERRIAARYDYQDETGKLLYQKIRYEWDVHEDVCTPWVDKAFGYRRPDGTSGWIDKLGDVRRVPYRLPELIAAIKDGRTIHVVEGEKDVERLRSIGLCATTSKDWTEFADYFRGANVIVVGDNDDPGCKIARDRYGDLEGVTASLRIIERMPEVAEKGDVSDWLDAHNNDGAAFNRLIDVHAKTELSSCGELPPLPPLYTPAPNLPPEMVPEPLLRYATDIADRMNCPLEYVVAPLITALATVIGSTIRIHPKKCDDWTVFLNLWTMIVGPPSVKKTPAMNQAIKPLTTLVKNAKAQFKDDKRRKTYKLEVAQTDADKLRKGIPNSAKRDVDILAYEDKRAEIDELKAFTERRYMTSDATKEALTKLFEANPQGLLLWRDELFGWLQNMATEPRSGERQFFLECWNGDGGFRDDRMTREGTNADLMCLSVLGGIQPGRLNALVRSASDDKSAGNDGLLQRFQMTVHPDERPAWKNVDRAPDREAEKCVTAIFERLDAFARTISPDQPVILHFDSAAQDVFNAWLDDIELKLRTVDVHVNPALEEHLGKYRSLMPKLAAIFHLTKIFTQPEPPLAKVAEIPDGENIATLATRVSADYAIMAADWCDYLEAHARKVYGACSAESAARALAERIESGEVKDGSTIRDLDRRHFSGLDTTERCMAAAGVLERSGWLSLAQPHKVQGRGRQPTSPKLVFTDALKATLKGEPA